MNTTTLPIGFGLLIATTSTAFSMPVVNVDDMIVSARSIISVEDQPLAQNDWDQELNSGFQWADADQNSVANASIEAGASGHGHSACQAEETPMGFRVWSYAYGSSYAKPDQEVEFDVSAGGQFGFEIERRTRVTGYACAWEDAPLSRGQTRAILWGNTDQGFVRPLDHNVRDGQECTNFQFILDPGQYEFNMSSWMLVTNEGAGQFDNWSESEAELKFEELASPDVDFDGDVDGADLAKFLGAWGTSMWEHDFNEDGIVDGADLSILLGMWTE